MAEFSLTKCSREIPCEFAEQAFTVDCQNEYDRLRQAVSSIDAKAESENLTALSRAARCPIIIQRAIEATAAYDRQIQSLMYMVLADDVEMQVNERRDDFEDGGCL